MGHWFKCPLRGPGGLWPGEVEIEFSNVSNRGEYQLPDAFYRIKKILFLAKVIGFWNLENMGNYSTRVNFKRDFGIWKSISSYSFWD